MCTNCSIKQPQRRDSEYYCLQEPEFTLGSHTTKARRNESLNPSVLSRPYLNASLQWAEEKSNGGGTQQPTASEWAAQDLGCCSMLWGILGGMGWSSSHRVLPPRHCGREHGGPNQRRGGLRRQHDATRETQHGAQVKHAPLCSEALLNTSLQTSAIRLTGSESKHVVLLNPYSWIHSWSF